MPNSTINELLVIDDNDDEWEIIRRTLEQTVPGLKVVRANGGEQALSLLSTGFEYRLPKLILLDWYLPAPADGEQLLQTLKAPTSVYRSIPVVIFSHSGLKEDIYTAYEQGCSSYIVKAIDRDQWQESFKIMAEYWWRTATVPVLIK